MSALPGLILGTLFFNFADDLTNIALRATGRVAFFYLALSLVISPINTLTKERFSSTLLELRKILGILSFLFFLKHGLDYFMIESFYYTKYYTSVYSLFGYIGHNILSRTDVWIGLVA